MNTTQTLSTTFAADTDLIEALRQSIDATGDTYPNAEGVQVPYILEEREVTNGSGRVVGTEYTVTDETYADLAAAVEVAAQIAEDAE